MPNASEYSSQDDFMGYCVPKMKEDGKTDEEALAACNAMWADRDKDKEMELLFSFTDLSGQLNAKYIDGLAVGQFVSMNGKPVEFRDHEFEEYVKNTQKIIDSTKTTDGRVVGLPIDMNSHDHQGGAGWIVGMKVNRARKIIEFAIDWTDQGRKVVADNIRRFFSPSVNPLKKVILGGSLTNNPATRDTATGKYLLRPIELSAQINVYQKENEMAEPTELEKKVDQLTKDLTALATTNKALTDTNALLTKRLKALDPEGDEEVSPEMLDFISSVDGAERIGEEAKLMAAKIVRREQRKTEVRDFAAQVMGGTADKPFGVPVKASELAAVLLSMPDRNRIFMQNVIMKLYDGAIDFARHGSGGLGGGAFAGKQVPAAYRQTLKVWVDAGREAKDWFTEVAADLGLGEANDYNLSEFVAAKVEDDE
jgi:hypothetical protein